MIGGRMFDGFAALTLATPDDGGLEAAFVPAAGMVGCSLRHRGQELLGQRGGLAAYVAERKTMGIPLLYPWANRLSAWRCAVAGREVVIDPGATPPRRDANGLPMHGLLSAAAGWRVERHEATGGGGMLTARFDFSADDVLMAAFPFAHELVLEATLSGPTLRLATTVHASGDAPVPIAFGFHPYLRLDGVDREDWRVEIPVRERLRLDPQMLPTGEREPVRIAPGRLGARTFDDARQRTGDGRPRADAARPRRQLPGGVLDHRTGSRRITRFGVDGPGPSLGRCAHEPRSRACGGRPARHAVDRRLVSRV